jgi:hypothetical protein
MVEGFGTYFEKFAKALYFGVGNFLRKLNVDSHPSLPYPCH